jgi:osmotically-inducible protein OsmY
VDVATRRVSGLLLKRGLLGADLRVVPVAEAVFDGQTIRVSVQSDALSPYRRDSELLRAVRDALARHPYVTGDDRRALGVDAVDGVAHLSGNVRTPQVEAFVREAASSVPGVLDVRGDVMNDRELEIEIGQALERAGLFRHGRIYARAALGEVTLGGYVSSEGVVADAERAAARVPGVRSVTNLIQVSRTPPTAAA